MKNMLNLIQSAFQKTHARYCKILNNYYPAHKSAGFTERNLTGNFVYCLEQLLGENAISWFEAPINLETKEHIDAVVFDLERKHSILIEAKRFSNPGKKIIEAKSDIERLRNPENHNVLERELRDMTIESRYGIILADVWKETKTKNEIYDTWPESICDRGEVLWSGKCGFEGLEINGEWKNFYNLLIAVFEV
jgi:hypothetical protein